MDTSGLALSVLAFLDVPAPEFVEIAAVAGFSAVSLRVTGSGERTPADLDEPARVAQVVHKLRDTGIGVIDAEVLRLGPELGTDDIRRALDVAHAVGARHVLTVDEGWGEEAALVTQLEAVRQLAEPAGVRPCLEFMRFSRCHDLRAAVSASVRAGVSVLVDLLHLFRSGGDVDLLRAEVSLHGRSLFPYAQVCDAPLAPPALDGGLRTEAVTRRLLPGAGGLPVAEAVAALPDGVPLAVEAPNARLNGLPPHERAALTMQSVREALGDTVPSGRVASAPVGGAR